MVSYPWETIPSESGLEGDATALPATKDDADIATRHPQFAPLVSTGLCKRVNTSRNDFPDQPNPAFLQRSPKRRDTSGRDVHHQAPADFRIQKMRAADEKSNQMQAYVKV